MAQVTHIKHVEVGIKHNHIFFITGEVPIEDKSSYVTANAANSAYERSCGSVFCDE